MSIVKYFYDYDNQKLFDVKQALKDSGWGIMFKDILETNGLKLVDRNDPKSKVTVSRITLDRLFATYFVHYVEGGWNCLDHAVEQFALDERS